MFTMLMASDEFEDLIGRFLSQEPRQPLGKFHFTKKRQRAVRRITFIRWADVTENIPEFIKMWLV